MNIKKIDLYIVIQFVKNLLFALICFIFIFILVDLFENLDKIIDNHMTLGLVIKYYALYIPEIVRLVTPIAVLLSTLFTVGRMLNFNELTALKNAGISLFRFMMPFLITGAVITGISIYTNNWLVPEANKQKFSIERNYLGKYREYTGLSRLYFQDLKNQFVTINLFNDVQLSATGVSILVFNPDTLTKLVKRVDADRMKWENNGWVLYNALVRSFNSEIEGIKKYDSVSVNDIEGISRLNLNPSQITKKQLLPDEMNYSELKEFIVSQQKGGQNTDKLQVDYYSKISFPFSTLIVIIFGISISTGTQKQKGLAMQFGISILVSFIYLGFEKISQTFGYNGDLNPVLTAWLANLAFALFGGINLYLKNY